MGKQVNNQIQNYNEMQNIYGTHLYNEGWEFVKLPLSVTIDSLDEQ